MSPHTPPVRRRTLLTGPRQHLATPTTMHRPPTTWRALLTPSAMQDEYAAGGPSLEALEALVRARMETDPSLGGGDLLLDTGVHGLPALAAEEPVIMVPHEDAAPGASPAAMRGVSPQRLWMDLASPSGPVPMSLAGEFQARVVCSDQLPPVAMRAHVCHTECCRACLPSANALPPARLSSAGISVCGISSTRGYLCARDVPVIMCYVDVAPRQHDPVQLGICAAEWRRHGAHGGGGNDGGDRPGGVRPVRGGARRRRRHARLAEPGGRRSRRRGARLSRATALSVVLSQDV